MVKTACSKNGIFIDPPLSKKVEFFSVASKSIPGKSYTIRLFPDGELRCECPYFVFKNKLCSHLEIIKKRRG